MGFGILSLTVYTARRGLVWCRALRTVLPFPALMSYDVGSLRLRMTVVSSHGCLGEVRVITLSPGKYGLSVRFILPFGDAWFVAQPAVLDLWLRRCFALGIG